MSHSESTWAEVARPQPDDLAEDLAEVVCRGFEKVFAGGLRHVGERDLEVCLRSSQVPSADPRGGGGEGAARCSQKTER